MYITSQQSYVKDGLETLDPRITNLYSYRITKKKTLPTIRSQDKMCIMAHKWDTARTQVKSNHAATRKTCVPASTAAIQVPILPARTKSRSRTANKTTAPSTVDYHQSTTYLTNRWCHHYPNTINQPKYPNSVMAVHDICPSFVCIRPRITPLPNTCVPKVSQ